MTAAAAAAAAQRLQLLLLHAMLVMLALLLLSAQASSSQDAAAAAALHSLLQAARDSEPELARMSSGIVSLTSDTTGNPAPLTLHSHSPRALRRSMRERGLPPRLRLRAGMAAAAADAATCIPLLHLEEDGEAREAACPTRRLHVACVRRVGMGEAEDGEGLRMHLATSSVSCDFADATAPAESDDATWRLSILAAQQRAAAQRLLEQHADFFKVAASRSRQRRSANGEADLAAGVGSFVSKFPLLSRLVSSSSVSAPVRRITSRGFVTFSQRASLQAIESVQASRLSDFAEYLLDLIGVAPDARPAIRRGVFDLLPMIGSTEWHDFKMLFRSGSGGRTKYANLLAHRSSEGYDFVVADFQTTFSLAPDLVVVETSSSSMWGAFGSSRTVLKKIPASITDKDMEVLMTFFDLAAFRRFAQMLQVPLRSRSRRTAAAAGAWVGAVQAGIKTYSMFAKAFSTKRTSRIVGKIVGKGFNYFSMRSRVHIISSMQPSFLQTYLQSMHFLYDLPQKYMREIKVVLQLVRFAGHQDWNKNDFLFDVNAGGSNGWVTILSNRNRDGTFNFLIANVKQRFRLAPNILIIKESKSVLGGIYQSEKVKFKRMPRGITEADIQALTNFFNIITFKRFGMRMDVDTSELDPK